MLENKVSIFTNPGDKGLVTGEMTFLEILTGTKEGRWRDVVEKAQRDGGRNYATVKNSEFSAYTPAATFHGRRLGALMSQHSGIVIIDIDDQQLMTMGATTEDVFNRLAKDEACLFVFRSPSGVGVKAGFAVERGILNPVQHIQAYDAVVAHLGDVVTDPSGCDVTRLCYFSYDPETFYREGPKRLPWAHMPERYNIVAEDYQGDISETVVSELQAYIEAYKSPNYDYGEGSTGTCDVVRSDRAQAIQEWIETKYANMAAWMGAQIEWGHHLDPGIKEPPTNDSTRSGYIWRTFNQWVRDGGDPAEIMAIIMCPDFGISEYFYFLPDDKGGGIRVWPRSRGLEGQVRREFGRAMALSQETDAQPEVEKDGVSAQFESRYPEQKEIWEEVLGRLSDKRKTKGKKPQDVAKDLVRAGIDTGLVSQTLIEYFPDKEPGKMMSLVRMVTKELDDARKAAADDLEELNAKHFRIRRYGSNSPVATVEKDGVITLQTHRVFKESYSDRQVLSHNGKSMVSLGEMWLSHPESRCYERMVFEPSLSDDDEVYNLWRGFPHKPKEGDISPIKDYLLNILCGGNTEYFQYIWMWLAHLAQKPHVMPEVSIVLRGEEGVGKSFFAETLCRGLVGDRHYKKEMDPFAKFNAHTQTTIVMFYDEYTFRASKQSSAQLRATISAPTRSIERKGFDRIEQPNCLHIIIASNDERVIDANNEARRFFVLEVSDKKKHNSKYFADIEAHLQNGGYEALMYELLQVEGIEDRLPIPPQTEGLNAQRELSLTTFEMWWRVILENGFIEDTTWPKEVATEVLVESCIAYFEKFGDRNERPPNSVNLGRKLNRLCTTARGQEPSGSRRRTRILPDLEKCRAEFEKATRQEGLIEWGEEAEEPPPF